MRKRVARIGIRVASFFLAMMFMVTPAFAIVREVNVYGVKSINDLGSSDQRIDMDTLKDAYSDYVQTDTLREYFHKDKSEPTKVDLDQALSWLIDNNIISRDQTITVSNCGSNQIPKVNIEKFDVDLLKGMNVTRADMLMYTYKAAFGPIYARAIAVETDNIRVDDGVEKTLKQMMEEQGYTTNPSNALPGTGTTTTNGSSGTAGSGNGGGGSASSGSNQQTNYINDMSNWRYQPQGDLWESIFGDTNIFISQNNFQQGITGGNGGNGGGGGAGIGGGGSGGGGNGGTTSNQTQVNTGNVGSVQGNDNNQTNTNSNNVSGTGNPVSGEGSPSGSTGGGSASYSSGTGGNGGQGGNADTGNNYIDYDTDYKQIYFIPGADLLVYHTSDVLEVYIQAALSKGLLGFDAASRSDEFNSYFVQWREQNKTKLRSWDGGSPTYVVNRTRNIIKTVSDTETVPTQRVLGSGWTVSWQSNTLTINRPNIFASESDYFSNDMASKMDAYRYVYNFIRGSEKVLSELEADIVNYKYGMELDGITSDDDTEIIKYLIAKGIINYEVTNEFMSLDAPVSWSEFLTLIYRVANKDARLDFSKIQLTDSETQWKAKGYSPQTTYAVPGELQATTKVMTIAEYATQDFGTTPNETLGIDGTGIPSIQEVAQSQGNDGRMYVNFGAPTEDQYIFAETIMNEIFFYQLTATFEGAMNNSASSNGSSYENVADMAKMLDISVPSSNVGKYVLAQMYALITSNKNNITATWTHGFDRNNPKFKILGNVVCNIWALNDIVNTGNTDVRTILNAATKPVSKMSDDLKTTLDSLSSGSAEEFVTAMSYVSSLYKDNAETNRIFFNKFQFTLEDGTVVENSTNWVSYTGGDVKKLVQYITGIELIIRNSNVDGQAIGQDQPRPFAISSPRTTGVTRSVGTAKEPWDFQLPITLCTHLINQNLSDEDKRNQELYGFSNNISTFTNLENLSDTPLQTFVEPNTNECYIAWSDIEKYRQTTSVGDKSLPIKKISDFLLYNSDTDTYAYFNNEGEDKRALVGTDVVICNNDYGVAYKVGDEVYYLIDALRLLMDSKQESEVLGGQRTMPLASTAVQNNITKVQLDMNTGAASTSLTGVRVMLSDNDEQTKTHVTNTNSVYYYDTNVYNNVRWGLFLSVSQSNRAVNATARQFSYTGKDGSKLAAYAVVIFEPLSPSDMGYTTVDATDSLQDLLDSPMKQPEGEADRELWTKNKVRSNLLANWIYGTTGREYISTGYLEPHAYIFSSDPDIAGCMTDAEWGALTTKPNADADLGSERELVEFKRLYLVRSGAVDRFDSTTRWAADTVRNSPEHQASYMLSEDYQLCVLGNRIYLNMGCFKHLSKESGAKVRTKNTVLGSSAFTVGSTFKSICGTYVDGHLAPKIMVTKTESNGMVTCQVGPIYGIPFVPGSGNSPVVIHNWSDKKTSTKSIGEYDWTTSANNQIQYVFEYMFQPTGRTEAYADIDLLGINTDPTLDADSTRAFVFDGEYVNSYQGEVRTNRNKRAKLANFATFNSGTAMSSVLGSINIPGHHTDLEGDITDGNVETYFNIRFNAFNYTVEGGILRYRPNQASDYISPSLFSSLNDLIINGVINADNGAIPVEQIPFGSLLQVGSGWYVSHGTSEDDIGFVGYAPLEGFTIYNDHATIQDCANSFGSQFIRAGNQNINVSHFFNTVEVLKGTAEVNDDLKILNDSKMAEDPSTSKKFILGEADEQGNQNIGNIYTSPNSSASVMYYAPVNITFQKGLLLAYKTSGEDTEPERYALCSTAQSSTSGPLSDLPFFSDNALSGSMSDRTSKANSGGFVPFYGADFLMDSIHADFQKAFAGDLFTLARMLVFIILIWLVVASWLCYGTYFGGLMPILDAIKHPTGNQAGSGIDLMKIVSLGSISMETDFKLGRFIQYNLVLAALLCVVYLTGIYL